MRLATVVTIVHLCHEATNAGDGRVLAKTSHLAIGFDAIVLERLQRNRLVFSLDLFGFGVDLFLAFLATSTQSQD